MGCHIAIADETPFPKQYADKLRIFRSGEGVYLEDQSGKRFLDFGSGIAVNALGYGREDLAQTAYEQMKNLIHTSNLYTTEAVLELGIKICATGNFDAVHFGNSGAEANEAALKYARLYAGKKRGPGHHKLLCFENGFHGRTLGALSVTPTSKYQAPYEPLLPGVATAPYNDPERLESLLDESFAAVIVEPIQGEGGLSVLSRETAETLNRLCRRYDILLIADEVQTGVGRTGVPYASALVGLEPDIITLAKPLAGGLPLSATLIPARVNELLAPGDHGSTFGGGPVTAAVASKVLDTIYDPGFFIHVQNAGSHLRRRLEAFCQRHSAARQVRGLGLMQGLVLGRDSDQGAQLLPKVMEAAFEQGLLLLRSGKDVLRILPPLVISEKELDEGLDLLDAILGDLSGETE